MIQSISNELKDNKGQHEICCSKIETIKVWKMSRQNVVAIDPIQGHNGVIRGSSSYWRSSCKKLAFFAYCTQYQEDEPEAQEWADELSPDELERLLNHDHGWLIANPHQFKVPSWFLNRKKYYKDGRFSQEPLWSVTTGVYLSVASTPRLPKGMERL
ncbi:40S ribosomal protein S18 [Zea mays]|uniref:40S ribosomal protein S18 n=1 Tax=Zea mays TaxID=4577 RepID=A0A3L6FSV3_MAIZE|nr:40S ribosomal protein S18 [Zea mays]